MQEAQRRSCARAARRRRTGRAAPPSPARPTSIALVRNAPRETRRFRTAENATVPNVTGNSRQVSTSGRPANRPASACARSRRSRSQREAGAIHGMPPTETAWTTTATVGERDRRQPERESFSPRSTTPSRDRKQRVDVIAQAGFDDPMGGDALDIDRPVRRDQQTGHRQRPYQPLRRQHRAGSS